MNRKSIIIVILMAMVFCLSTAVLTKPVYADTVSGHALYPYDQVKQEAINALNKAESTDNWDDITKAWMEVDGLTMHPDYNGDPEVNALNNRVNNLYDKFAAEKNNEAANQQPQPSKPAVSTPVQPPKPAPVSPVPAASNTSSSNERKIIRVEETVTVTPIPAGPFTNISNIPFGLVSILQPQSYSKIVTYPAAENNVSSGKSNTNQTIAPGVVVSAVQNENKSTATSPQKFGFGVVAEGTTLTTPGNSKPKTDSINLSSGGVFAGVVAAITAIIKSFKSMF